MQSYEFDKNEYNYWATQLVYGPHSTNLKHFGAFSFPVFRKEEELKIVQVDNVGVSQRLERERTLHISGGRSLITTYVDLRSDIGRVLTFSDPHNKVFISDALFTDDEFEYYERNWDQTVQNKVKNLGLLIQSIHKCVLDLIPVFMGEYPNIAAVILKYPDFLSEQRSQQ